ncbi:MAG: hypothetical protein WDN49_16745 [Acetobacteraceae bacterium]
MTGQQILETGPQPGTVRVTLKDNLDAATQLLLDHVDHLHGPKKVDDWALKHDAQGFANGRRHAGAGSLGDPLRQDQRAGGAHGRRADPARQGVGRVQPRRCLAVNKDSKLKAAAWDFIRLLQGQAYLDNLLATSGWIPLRKDRDFSAFLAKNPDYRPLMEDSPATNPMWKRRTRPIRKSPPAPAR